MAINFPDPSGQTPLNEFSPTSSPSSTTNGVTYNYTNNKWVAQADAAGDVDLSGFYNKTESDDRFVNVDGDIMTGDLTVPSLNGGQLAGFRNQIINGDFRVWQRGETINAGSTFSADRWRLGGNAHTAQKSNFAANIGVSGINVVNAAGGTGIFQGIELPVDGTTGRCGPFILNSVWTLSWYEPTAQLGTSNQPGAGAAFTDSSGGTNAQALTVGATESGEVIGSFTRRIAQVTISASPVATNRCLRVGFSTEGTNFQIFGVQFEPGPVATPFEHRPIGTELELCQRYYYFTNAYMIASKVSDVYNGWRVLVADFPVTMRAVPTMDGTVGFDGAGTFNTFEAYTSGYRVESTQDSVSSYMSVINVSADAEL